MLMQIFEKPTSKSGHWTSKSYWVQWHAPVIQLLWRPNFGTVRGSIPVGGNSPSIGGWIV